MEDGQIKNQALRWKQENPNVKAVGEGASGLLCFIGEWDVASKYQLIPTIQQESNCETVTQHTHVTCRALSSLTFLALNQETNPANSASTSASTGNNIR